VTVLDVYGSLPYAGARTLHSLTCPTRHSAGASAGLEPNLTDRLMRSAHVDGPIRTFEVISIAGESATSTPRHGWLRGTTDEPSLGYLGSPGIIRFVGGDGETRPVTVSERVGGQAMCDHAEQHGEGDH
jgi:hypothetical protein